MKTFLKIKHKYTFEGVFDFLLLVDKLLLLLFGVFEGLYLFKDFLSESFEFLLFKLLELYYRCRSYVLNALGVFFYIF